MSSTAEQTRNGTTGLNDPNLFRTNWRPLDMNSQEYKTVQQIRQRCDDLVKFIDSSIVKGQSSEEVNLIKTKAMELSFWANHFATRDKTSGGQSNTLHSNQPSQR